MGTKNYRVTIIKSSFLFCLIFSSISSVNSQSNNYLNFKESNIDQDEFTPVEETKFKRISSGEELHSTAYVTSIVQDNYGFMWFGTNFGLIRFDGYNSKVIYGYKIYSQVNCIFKDHGGTIWIGTNGLYIGMYDENSGQFALLDMDEEGNTPQNSTVLSINEDKTGDLIIGTSNSGFMIYDKKKKKFQHYYDKGDSSNKGISSNSVLSVFSDRNSLIYIGTQDKGLYTFDKESGFFTNYQNSSADYKSISDNRIQCIYEDTDNNIWIGTRNGLNLFDNVNKNFIRFINEVNNPVSLSNNNISSIIEDKNNDLWIATNGGGLNKLDDDSTFSRFKSKINDPSSLSSDYVKNIYVDNANVLWIATPGGGICKLDCGRKKFHTVSDFFQNSRLSKHNQIGSIYRDKSGIVWAMQRQNSGIFKFIKNKKGSLNFIEHVTIPNSNLTGGINGCLEDKNGNLWFCSWDGKLIEYERKKNSFRIFTNNSNQVFRGMCFLDENSIFISSVNAGFLKFDIMKKEFLYLNPDSEILSSISNHDISFALKDKENNLWFTAGGLFKYEIDKDKITNYRNIKGDTTSMQGEKVLSIVENSKGDLLVETELGLNKLDQSNGTFKFYPGGVALLDDENGNLWTTADDGLYKYNMEKGTKYKYSESDGLQGNEFFGEEAAFKDEDGILYFGGSNGFTYFNPSEIKDNPYIPNIVLTDFKILNETVKPSPENPFLKKNITIAKDITLSYKENVFSFEFAGLIYNNPSKNQYAYIMEGFDKDWVYCGTRRNVTYTNLDPGEYTFRVKGSNNDGIWNEEGTSIQITITPPWWQTWWFKSCGAAFVLLTAGFGYKKRVNKLKKEKLAQEEYSRKLLASQEDERKRIANELHDSIAHDILILKNDVDNAKNETTDEKTISALNKISDHSTETLNDVRNISYNLHPHQIEALGLTKAIRSMIDKVSGSTKINFISDIDNIDKIFTEENELHVYRIIQEGISNIIKYSDSAEAIIKISCNKELVSILISDNGKGFDVDNVEKGSLGLHGISERVNILGGNLNIESKRGEGTLVKILIPV